MSLPVRLGSGAQHDVADTVAWYETQRPGLGERFTKALDGLFNRMAENLRQFPVIESKVRRVLLRRFPYAIFHAAGCCGAAWETNKGVMPMADFLGIVIDQSIRNKDFIHHMNVVARRQVGAWGFLLVSVPGQELHTWIAALQQSMVDIKDHGWYAHFFRDDELIVVYQDRVFHTTVDPETWSATIQHGLNNGIPREQLDFNPRTRGDAWAYFDDATDGDGSS